MPKSSAMVGRDTVTMLTSSPSISAARKMMASVITQPCGSFSEVIPSLRTPRRWNPMTAPSA